MQLSGWGRYPRIEADVRRLRRPDDLLTYLEMGPVGLHGLGRSYGDSALAPRTLLTRPLDLLLDFDPLKGELTCQPGVSLREIVDAFLPRGWFLGVTPGTMDVTVGGAIASDVHGKNHHIDGCFSRDVLEFDLLLPNGETRRCSATENEDLFRATCGGMGLTGLITRVRLRLRPVASAFIRQTVIKSRNLAETFELFEASQDVTYSVAWIDCLAQGEHLGRCLLMFGEHAESAPRRLANGLRLNVPLETPGFLLNSHSVRLFNFLYYNKVRRRESRSLVPLKSFFYPLDAIANWNRLYGSRGLLQYQFVLPKAAGMEGLREILSRIAHTGMGSFLAVLKLFGPENGNYLSFPMEGCTLALDFKVEPRLFPRLDALAQGVIRDGGRLYLAKDSRMSAGTFQAGYPLLDEFRAIREKHGLANFFSTMQSKRLEI